MKTIILFLSLLLGIISISCEDASPVEEKKDPNLTKNTQEVIKADNAFGIDLFKEVISKTNPDSNIMISPTSAAMALAMTYNGAAGTTKTAMETALRKEGLTAEEINEVYKSLAEDLTTVDPEVILNIANSIWYRMEYPVLEDFINININYYQAEVNQVDFNDPATVGLINNWVDEKTNHLIPTILNSISPDAVMYLINAIYFKGIWTSEFDPDLTYQGTFHKSETESYTVDMMKQKGVFWYGTNNTFTSVLLPYGNGNYSMTILLPKDDKGCEDIINDLTPENWSAWINAMDTIELTIHLPKFKFAFEDTLNTPLSNMGMGIAFTGAADFSGINPARDIFISKVRQKTFIDVNEEGTEAAAVTIVEMELTAIIDEIRVYVNKPFLFAITEKETQAILFIGKVVIPRYEE